MTDAALLFSSTTNLAVTKNVWPHLPPPSSQLVWLTNAVRLHSRWYQFTLGAPP